MTLEQVINKAVRYFTPESLLGADVYYGDSLSSIRDQIKYDRPTCIVAEIYPNSMYKFSVIPGICWKYAVPKFVIDDWKRNKEECMTLKSKYFTSRYGRSSSLASGFLSEEEIIRNSLFYREINLQNNMLETAKEKNMNAVKVNYWNDGTERFESKDYTFLVEGEYKEGDYLVFRNYDGNLATVKVVSFITDLSTLPLGINYKDMVVLGKADMSPYQAMVDKKEREARKAEILEELESKFEEANKMALYKELAKKDKDMADLLKELEGLDK